jgi:hypothetical protein
MNLKKFNLKKLKQPKIWNRGSRRLSVVLNMELLSTWQASFDWSVRIDNTIKLAIVDLFQ